MIADPIRVIDDVLPDPHAYRALALQSAFGDLQAGDVVFRGMALVGANPFTDWLQGYGLAPTLSAFRLSPHGQVEPNFIHHDRSMGDWTAILYLNPDPPGTDGTTFWRDRITDAEVSTGADDDSAAWADPDRWEPTRTIPAVFNRVLLFEAGRYHSRALFANYGASADDARLIQLVFGTGTLPGGG